MKHQSVAVNLEDRKNLFEDTVADLVDKCQGIIMKRLGQLFSGISGQDLAEQLWQGSLDSRRLRQALPGLEQLPGFLASLSGELGSLTASLFGKPVLLQFKVKQEGVPEEQAMLLGEQLAWSRETHILGKALVEACYIVWNQAVADCAWPVQRLNPCKMLWRLFGTTTAEDERRHLQELTRAVEGARVNMQKRLCREISRQTALQIWSIYDSRIEDQTFGALMNTQVDYCA